MRILVNLFLILQIFCSTLLLSQNTQKETHKIGNLFVIVSNLKNNSGDVKIGLFNSEESFKGKSEKYRGSVLKIINNRAEWRIENIPYGEYAIKLFHDEDSDDEIDTNFLGIPKESYGFSNNAKGIFGPPSFEKAKFQFKDKEMRIEIKLN